MTSPRVELLDLDAAHAAAERVGIPAQMAELSVFRALLGHEEVAAALNGLLHQLLWNGILEPRLRELLIMRIGWVRGSDYEWTQHWRVARLFEIPEEHLLAVRDWERSGCFDRTDRAVLAATDETLEYGFISAPTWAELDATLDPRARIEVVIAIANWSMFAQLLRSLAIPLEEGTQSWPPDGRPAPAALLDPPSRVGATPARRARKAAP